MYLSPIHAPCPDMAGTAEFDANKRERALYFVRKLREKHGLTKKQLTDSSRHPLNYTCTERGCVEPWERNP